MYKKIWLNCKSVLLSLIGTKQPRGKADGSAGKPPQEKEGDRRYVKYMYNVVFTLYIL